MLISKKVLYPALFLVLGFCVPTASAQWAENPIDSDIRIPSWVDTSDYPRLSSFTAEELREVTCLGDPYADCDGDGYSNADEAAIGSNPSDPYDLSGGGDSSAGSGGYSAPIE